MAKKAKESSHIERARRKIEKQLLISENQMNEAALSRMRLLIEQQLNRHLPERISSKKRQIVLFDENQNPAKTESKFIKHLLEEIKEGKLRKNKLKLEGRVTSINRKSLNANNE